MDRVFIQAISLAASPLFILAISLGISLEADAHRRITTAITWNREIARIFYDRCVSCHHEGGAAFSMVTYAEAYPWKTAIKEETLERRMPPWGAVKGFGEFRSDQALTPEQLQLITSWAEGGAPEGDPGDLPEPPDLGDAILEADWFPDRTHFTNVPGAVAVSGDFIMEHPFTLHGLWPQSVPERASVQIVAEFPDGQIEPLLWLNGYKTAIGHPFLLRAPLDLPAGTIVRGVPEDSTVILLPLARPQTDNESQLLEN